MNLPEAWTECQSGVCPGHTKPVKNKGKDTFTIRMADTPKQKCEGALCDCKLFSAAADDDDGSEKWSWEYNPNNVYKADDKKFKWICVKPNIDFDDDVLCSDGGCDLKVVDDDDSQVTCRANKTKKCDSPCRCKLFELERGLDETAKRNKKWKQIGHPAKKKDGYVYLCLCLKPK